LRSTLAARRRNQNPPEPIRLLGNVPPPAGWDWARSYDCADECGKARKTSRPGDFEQAADKQPDVKLGFTHAVFGADVSVPLGRGRFMKRIVVP
jgi:hypothetical protein